MGGGRPLSSSDLFCQLAAHENVEVRLYNPLNLLAPWKTNYRMHDKYLIADDLAYLLGGRNTDNRFLGRYTDHYNVDRDILVYETEPGQGQSYRQLRDYFHRIWSLPCCKVLDQPERAKTCPAAMRRQGPGIPRRSPIPSPGPSGRPLPWRLRG